MPQFKLYQICDITSPPHKNLFKMFQDVKYMWWENQGLELQEWEDCIKLKKTIIQDIIMFVPCKNLPESK